MALAFITLLVSVLLLPLTNAQTTAVATTITASTTTLLVAAPTTPPSPQYTDSLTLRTSMLNSTNYFRYQHNASYIPWNASLASYAASYAAQCVWAHSHATQGYGENLARGYPDVTSAVDAWGNERDLYTFAPPSAVTGFSEQTGHFTQLVWKNTQSVGCGVQNCDGRNGVGGWLVVCEYWPPGNVEGIGSSKNQFFEQNVQAQIRQGSAGFDVLSATAGATGVTGWATGPNVPVVTGASGGGRVVGSIDRLGIFGIVVAIWMAVEGE